MLAAMKEIINPDVVIHYDTAKKQEVTMMKRRQSGKRRCWIRERMNIN